MGGATEVEAVKRHFEFSKWILIVSSLVFVGVLVYVCILMWVTMDTTAAAYLLPSASAPITAGVSFYFWKAKAENLLKLQKAGLKQGYDSYGGGFGGGYGGYGSYSNNVDVMDSGEENDL